MLVIRIEESVDRPEGWLFQVEAHSVGRLTSRSTYNSMPISAKSRCDQYPSCCQPTRRLILHSWHHSLDSLKAWLIFQFNLVDLCFKRLAFCHFEIIKVSRFTCLKSLALDLIILAIYYELIIHYSRKISSMKCIVMLTLNFTWWIFL